MFFWKENIDLSQMIDNFLDIKNTWNADKYEYLFEKLSISIDPRYIAFFSAILESPKNKILDKNLWIISWNYDSQIEKTLKMLWAPVPDKNQYIKLNWSAKVRLGKKALENAKDIINFTNQINELSSSIEYAWDDKEEILKKIWKMTQDTTKIIIIWYSFPVYNRYMDSSIFNLLWSFNHNKTLHIELVGSNESRLLEYENSVRAMLEPWDWFDANKPRELWHLQRWFMIKKSLSPGQFPIPNDLPIFGQKSISVPF